jgi:hypothetical protein
VQVSSQKKKKKKQKQKQKQKQIVITDPSLGQQTPQHEQKFELLNV